MKRLSMLCLVLALQGCSTYAGPFVTAISSDGNGGLNVESCMVRMNKFTKAVSNANCTSEHIQLRARQRKCYVLRYLRLPSLRYPDIL